METLFDIRSPESFFSSEMAEEGKDEKWRRKELVIFSPEYYALCAASGMVSAGATHLAITPLDVLKVNMQVLDFSSSYFSIGDLGVFSYNSFCRNLYTHTKFSIPAFFYFNSNLLKTFSS